MPVVRGLKDKPPPRLPRWEIGEVAITARPDSGSHTDHWAFDRYESRYRAGYDLLLGDCVWVRELVFVDASGTRTVLRSEPALIPGPRRSE